MSIETREEWRKSEYEYEKRQRLREYNDKQLISLIYEYTNKRQIEEFREILIEFIVENNLEVE